MRFSLLLPLVGFSLALNSSAETTAPSADVDISNQVYGNPLEEAARKANEGGETETIEKTVPQKTESTAATTPSATTAEAPKAVQTLASVAIEQKAGAPLLPAVPELAQTSYTQVGGLDLNYYNTPIEEVFRQLGRHLTRPLNYSLLRQYKVTGTWSQTPPDVILREVVSSKGLVLKESTVAYVVEDHGRNIPLPAATVRPQGGNISGNALADRLGESKLTEPVEPVSPKKLNKALTENDLKRQKALEARKSLLNQLEK